MQRLFFILGKNPTLSLAEIISLFTKEKKQFQCLGCSKEVGIFEVTETIDISDFMKSLGGTIKIGLIVDEFSFEQDAEKFEHITKADFVTKHFLPKMEGKLHIGISVYSCGSQQDLFDRFVRRAFSFNQEIKDNLKEIGIRIGFVQQKERYLSSVSVEKNKLLSKGAEIVFIVFQDSVWVGKTHVVQEFEQFSFRDYGRPVRDKRSGIIPPKLARMMINLSQVKRDETVLDAFCGSGTILQEAIMLGIKHVTGSDISQKAIIDTRQNIDWLFQYIHTINKMSYNIALYQSDVLTLDRQIKKNSIDAIVSEPFLGPPLYSNPSISHITNVFTELTRLYLIAFSRFLNILKQNGRIVIVFPVFISNERFYYLEILEKIKQMGYEQINLIPFKIAQTPQIFLTQRNTIIYGGDHDFTLREVLCFKKVG